MRVLAKFGVFNLAMALETALAVWVLQIPLSEMEMFGKWSIPILAVMLNVVFVLYDYSMNGLIVLYIRRLHPACTEIYKIKQPMAAVFRVPWAVRFVQLILR